MPTQKPINPLYYDEERRYNEAKEAYLDGQFENVTKCAKAFNLNRRNLANRINGACSKSTRRAANQRLTEAQELALFNYIRRLDEKCMSPDPTLITAAANFIIQEDDGLQLTTRDLDNVQKATAQKEGRNSLPGWRAKTSGIIRVEQCREQFSERAKKEGAAAQRKAEREAAKAEKQAQANAKAKKNRAEERSEEKDNTEEEEEDENEGNEEENTENYSPCPSPPRAPYNLSPPPPSRAPYNLSPPPPSPSPPAVVGSKRMRKPSRKAVEKDSDASPSPSPPPPRKRRRRNVNPD